MDVLLATVHGEQFPLSCCAEFQYRDLK